MAAAPARSPKTSERNPKMTKKKPAAAPTPTPTPLDSPPRRVTRSQNKGKSPMKYVAEPSEVVVASDRDGDEDDVLKIEETISATDGKGMGNRGDRAEEEATLVEVQPEPPRPLNALAFYQPERKGSSALLVQLNPELYGPGGIYTLTCGTLFSAIPNPHLKKVTKWKGDEYIRWCTGYTKFGGDWESVSRVVKTKTKDECLDLFQNKKVKMVTMATSLAHAVKLAGGAQVQQ